MERPVLSICIPSYNRGHRAKALVNRLLTMNLGNEVEVILSNNGSKENTEGYQELKRIEDDRFTYFEFKENHQYYGNVNQVIRLARGKFCLLISDEDDIIEENLKVYIQFMKEQPQTGVIRPATDGQYSEIKDTYSMGGEAAVEKIFMCNNYLSGIIYNRDVVDDALIDELERKYTGNSIYFHYIHLIIDIYAALRAPYAKISLVLVREGKAEAPENEYNNSYASYETRIDHMRGMCKVIKDIGESYEVRNTLRNTLISQMLVKTAYLIKLVKKNYEADGYDWTTISKYAVDEMKRVLFDEENMLPKEYYLDSVDNIIGKVIN